jgi:site-specific DNA recombinase
MEQGAVRCAVYTRQSVARKNSSDFSSCEAQRESCLSFIASHAGEGWFPVPERCDDEGYGGATAERLAFARLLRTVAVKKVDWVVVQRIDRITRSIADWGRLVVTLRRHGAGFSMVSGELHLGDIATSDLVLNLLATFAQFEREIIGERLRDARVSLRRRRRARSLHGALLEEGLGRQGGEVVLSTRLGDSLGRSSPAPQRDPRRGRHRTGACPPGGPG